MSGGLWFVTCVANPCGFRSRYNLYDAFADHILNVVGGNLLTVEVAFGDGEHALVPRESSPNYKLIQVRSKSRLWTKESQLNLGIANLPPEAEYVCWCDADVEFQQGAMIKRDIVEALQTWDVVQCFTVALDLGPQKEVMKVHHSFGFCHQMQIPVDIRNTGDETFYHSGYVWAARRSFLNDIGGLLDVGIVGSGDRMMAMGLVGRAEEYCDPAYSLDYRKHILEWQSRCRRAMTTGLGYCQAVIRHNFHGFKRDRQYSTRNEIISKHGFAPSTDICRNDKGIWEFSGNKPDLERDVLQYFVNRKEDAGSSPDTITGT